MILLLLATFSGTASAQYSEYQIKGGWLVSFAKYVTWPDKVFDSDDEPIIIGILGDDPFGEDLDNIVRNRKANGRPIIIRRNNDIRELKGAHIIFFSNSNELTISEVFKDYNSRKGILTIGDGISNFCELGGIINFRKDRPTTFDLNLEAAIDARLIIHSKLLQLAKKFVHYDN